VKGGTVEKRTPIASRAWGPVASTCRIVARGDHRLLAPCQRRDAGAVPSDGPAATASPCRIAAKGGYVAHAATAD